MIKITDSVYYVGVNDREIDLFESQYPVPQGISYNSYVILDEKIAVLDTVDIHFCHEWLDNVQNVLNGKKPDYLIIHHMEPDHSANIKNFMSVYPDTKIVGNEKTFAMMEQFFDFDISKNMLSVKDADKLSLGNHELTFVFAPMVHWPEVMVSYDSFEKILFSADAFGKFGALDAKEPWVDEARRYYIGIVGRYGDQVQTLLKKASELDIRIICSLHGPVITENIPYYINLYNTWSSYEVESDGIVVAYTSVYGNTKKAVDLLCEKLKEKGCPKIVVYDLARCDMTLAVSDAFRYGKLVLATTTYNSGIFPFMKNFIDKLTERNFRNRTVAFIENGTWVPRAAKIMTEMLSNLKNITFSQNSVSIKSSVKKENREQIDALALELCSEYATKSPVKANKNDMSALFNIGYGLYVVSSNDGKKDNGLIVNTVTQITNLPNRIAVAIDKNNYSHHVIKQTGKMNLNCLSVDTPFSIFKNFGFQCGRNTDKFSGIEMTRSDNGLAVLSENINSFLSLEVESYVDVGTHGMFICIITEAQILSEKETMTYNYYQNNVKPKPNKEKSKGYECKICGYVYEGEELPPDYICPLCKHGASAFEKI